MTAITMPARKWGDEPKPGPVAPVIIVSSRDGVPVPRVPAALRLVSLAETLGWRAVQTFAHARMADRDVHTVAVRMVRNRRRAVAVWHSSTGEPGTGWRFQLGIIGARSVGLRELTERLQESP
jgi:hypothetical protein